MMHLSSVLPRDKDNNCYCGGVVNWRTAVIHWVAKVVGLLVKVEGMPLGTTRNLDRSSQQSGICQPRAAILG
jgi:hypothetical protein